MDYDDLLALVDYHYWARDRLLEAVAPLSSDLLTKNLGNSFGSVHDTLVHLYGAEWMWCSRWNGESPEALPQPASLPTFDAVRDAWQQHEGLVRAALARYRERGVETPVVYERYGRTHAEPFSHQLLHMVNHASYHRGQVTTMLRQLGAPPPKSMDLIAFYREQATT